MPLTTSHEAYQDIVYDTHDGWTLYARDYPCKSDADSPNIKAPVIMCWHGLTRNSADFDTLARHLQDRFRVICPDQRGRGRSAYDDNSDNYALPIYCKDMLSLTQHLGLSEIIVIGTSMGGLMAMGMTVLAPDLITACVLNDIGPDINPAGLERIKGYVGMAQLYDSWQQAADSMKATNGSAFPQYTEADWLAFARRTCTQTKAGIRPSYDLRIAEPIMAQSAAAAPPNLWPLFEALVAAPALVVRGDTSDILQAQTYDSMVKAGASGVTVNGVGHAPMLDEPEAVKAIDDFLAALEY